MEALFSHADFLLFKIKVFFLVRKKLKFDTLSVIPLVILFFAERVGVQVVECACVIELPELKVSPPICKFSYSFQG